MSDTPRNALREPSQWYAHMVDTRDFTRLPEIFAPDAQLIVGETDPNAPPTFQFKGLDQIAAALQTIVMYPTTFHMLGQQLVLVCSADSAKTETYCRASHFYPLDGVQHEYIMYIRYIDDLQIKPDGGWRFTQRRLYVDAEVGTPRVLDA